MVRGERRFDRMQGLGTRSFFGYGTKVGGGGGEAQKKGLRGSSPDSIPKPSRIHGLGFRV